ncbi:MAG: serine protease [Magnetovibrio sp.]|nr:serine protease [Magnetovibrio sp.]|tara:strand:- start:3371 stop:4786 length:1416 start_codon:yes stop_codon:yes gene_type:complete
MKTTQKLLVFFSALFCLIIANKVSAEKNIPFSRQQVELSYAPLVKKSSPAVVNIFTRKIVKRRRMSTLFDDPFFRQFFGRVPRLGQSQKRIQNSLGSGVIVNADGLIVTNNHVIEGADEITVVLTDRREFEAEIVGTDERTDLALLRVSNEGEQLPFLSFRDSDELEVGDIVLAIGNPFGVGQTVTSGIVSALARTQEGVSDYASFIQTDAAINPGNSGGALIGMDGRLVGINTAIFSKSGGSLGIGFAIPSNMVSAVVSGMVKGGRIVRAWLGLSSQTVTSDIAATLNMSRPMGVLVKNVNPMSPAKKAGIKVGDVLLSIDGKLINKPKELRYRIATLVIGERVKLTVLRNGREKVLDLILMAPPEDPPRDIRTLTGNQPLSGVVVANMSPALADELGLEIYEEGIYVIGLEERGFASRLGLRIGDQIIEINSKAMKNTVSLESFLKKRTDRWVISIKREGKVKKVVVDR